MREQRHSAGRERSASRIDAPTSLRLGALRVAVVRDPREAAVALADELGALLDRLRADGRAPALGFAAGNSPAALYAELAARAADGRFDAAGATLFHLDEYLELPRDHAAGFRATLRRALHAPLGVPDERARFPVECDAKDRLDERCADYERSIARAGGIDWQLLGIGRNGHVAFNEPGSARDSRTRVVTLDEGTRAANAGSFASADEVPRHAATMGVATIGEARRLRWLAFGADKADAVRAFALGAPCADVPASWLRDHADGVLWCDAAAAARL